MTLKIMTLIYSSASITSVAAGVYEVWPPPANVILGVTLFLVAMMFPPAGLLLGAYMSLIVAIAGSRLTPVRKREELEKLVKPIFGIFDHMSRILKRLCGGGNGSD